MHGRAIRALAPVPLKFRWFVFSAGWYNYLSYLVWKYGFVEAKTKCISRAEQTYFRRGGARNEIIINITLQR